MRIRTSASSTSTIGRDLTWSSIRPLRWPSMASEISLWIRHSLAGTTWRSATSVSAHHPAAVAAPWQALTVSSMPRWTAFLVTSSTYLVSPRLVAHPPTGTRAGRGRTPGPAARRAGPGGSPAGPRRGVPGHGVVVHVVADLRHLRQGQDLVGFDAHQVGPDTRDDWVRIEQGDA